MTSPQSGATGASAGAGYTQTGGTGYAPPPSQEEYAYSHNTAQPLGEHAMTDEGHPDVEGTSVGELIGQVTTDLSTLMRQELDLAKAEVRAEANKATHEIKAQTGKAGKGAGMLGGAGFGGYMVALFLSLAAMWGLSNAMDTGWAALIVAAVWAVIAAVLYAMGRKQLKSVDFSRLKQLDPKPEQTVETLQQVPGALKPN